MGAEELAAAPKEEQGTAPPEKTEEGKKKEEEGTPKPPDPCVIYIDLHCVGCAKKIEKSILKIRGVEGVSIEMERNQVTIKGIVEPEAVCSKLMKRTKRMARVISPLPASDGQPIPDVVNSQVSGLVTVELNVNMHCEACAQQLKKKILKMRGVSSATTELSSEKVTVTGTMDPNKLVDYVYRHTKKQAKIVPQPEPKPEQETEQKPSPELDQEIKKDESKPDQGEKKELEGGGDINVGAGDADDQKKEDGEKKEEPLMLDEKKEEQVINNNNNNITEEQAMQRMMYYYQPLYVMERIPPPQLFSDENPNACSIT